MSKIITIIVLFFTLIANAQIVSIPDANFKAKLLSASSSNAIASTEAPVYNAITSTWSVGTYTSIDTNSDGQIQISEAILIKYINVKCFGCGNPQKITSLVGIQDFLSLEYFNCGGNLLGNLSAPLNISNPSIRYFNCSTNLIQSINVINLPNIIDFDCSHNSLNDPDVSSLTNLIRFNCSHNPLYSINISGLTQLEGLDCSWGFVMTTFDVSTNPNLKKIECQQSPIETVDFQNLTSLKFLNASDTSLQSFSFPIFSNPSTASEFSFSGCQSLEFINTKNGSYNSFIMDISGCTNLKYICKDENEGLNILQDAQTNNFQVGSYCSFVPGGNYNTITGKATYDNENDGCDSNDSIFKFLKIGMTNGLATGGTFTNAVGNYNFYTQLGNFTITPQLENPNYFTVSPTAAVVNFANNNNNTATQNFCITPNGVHTDVEVVFAPIDAARPGFDATYLVVFKNKGNQIVSGTIATTFNDNTLDFVSSTIPATAVATGQLTWDYVNLAPFENRSFYVTFNINSPTETPAVNIDDVLVFSTQITPLIDDIPSDNTFIFNQTVVGSFDPNEIICLEGATANASQIGEYLHYIVLFENTGTYQADNVVVKLEINPAQFDVNSLQELSASHPVYTRISNNTVEFIFENCLLASGPPSGGHGHVPFKMKTKQNLLPNDAVLNKANIYFDYNAPIITNDAETTFTLLNQDGFNRDNSVSITPNPTNSVININNKTTIKTIELYDIQGRLLQTQLLNSNTTTLDISEKANGIYFLKVKTAIGQKVEKIIKE